MQQYRIIIIDEHPLFRDALKQLLQLSLDTPTLIGEGLHQRAITDTGKFNDRLVVKAGRHV